MSEQEDDVASLLRQLRGADADRAAAVSTRLAELLDRKRLLGEHNHTALSLLTKRLDTALAAVVDTASATELGRTACAQFAELTGSRQVVMSSITDSGPAPVAVFAEGVDVPIPTIGSSWSDGSPATRAVSSRAVAYGTDLERHTTAIPVVVHGTVTAVVEIDVRVPDTVTHALTALAEAVAVRLEHITLLARERQQQRAVGETARTLLAATSTTDGAGEQGEPVGRSPGEHTYLEPLTDREKDVARLILTGASNSAIAAELVISIDTVKSHVKSILRKSGTTNRAELIARFRSGSAT
ncbi:LuxR C-terminal-related transcriptional regulator [Rhodococcus sp. NPDC057297]|uniref:LuxR family transcriptional regulator n=1 Tax=Rhodococcus sp. NPDC057297 TaxID=3346090 RepID=UPI003631460A